MGTTRLISRRRQDQGKKWARITMAILATIGVIDTGSITLSRWGWLGPISCPGGAEGCDQVLNSPWGTIFLNEGISIPLSFFGLVSYLSILLMAILPFLPGLSDSKTNLSRRTWWGLFTVSCGMAIFSLLLIGLMLFKIKAFCFFCILSGIISISLLLLTLLGGGWDDPGDLIFRGILIALAVILGGLLWASNADKKEIESVSMNQNSSPIVRNKSTEKQIALAKHLTTKDIVMYSAYWCPHCHDQKELFGKQAAKELKIIECAPDGQNSQHLLCKDKGVSGFPSWEINGRLESGVKSLDELAKLSNYKTN